MKQFAKWMFTHALALMISLSAAYAQERPAFSQAQLDQMLAPVALYPDALLTQVLMASTYPIEVVQAARWSRANPGYRGGDAVDAVQAKDWDPSIRALVAFPQILARMDERLEWTQSLGEAFLAQQEQVMDTVQGLRRRAAAAGNLGDDDYVRIAHADSYIVIEPARPGVIYVPYYNPVIAYGPWWWPAYPPVFWGPPPGYYAAPAHAYGLFWGNGISISLGFFFGAFDWHHRHVRIAPDYHRYAQVARLAGPGPVVWTHDSRHRRGVPYRYATPQSEFNRERPSATDSRRDFGQRNAPPAARLPGAASSPESNRRTDTMRRPDDRDDATVRTLPPGNQVRADSAAGRDRDEQARRVPGNTTEPRRGQAERPPSRVDEPRRQPRPDGGPRTLRNPEPAAAARNPAVRATNTPEPRARSAQEIMNRSSRPAPGDTQNISPPPRVPPVQSAGPQVSRTRESDNNGARSGRGDSNRQQSERSRDRRS